MKLISVNKSHALKQARDLALLSKLEDIGLGERFARVGGLKGLINEPKTVERQAVYLVLRTNLELEELEGAFADALKQEGRHLIELADTKYLPR